MKEISDMDLNKREILSSMTTFLNNRLLLNGIKTEECFLQIALISISSRYFSDAKEKEILYKNICLLREEISDKVKNKTLSIKFLCVIGHILYMKNSLYEKLNRFRTTYNALVKDCINDYIEQLKQIEDIELIDTSYEQGICCVINYLLLDSVFFTVQINELILLLDTSIKKKIIMEKINFGMKYGLNGVIYTLNQLKKKNIIHPSMPSLAREVFKVFIDNRTFIDGFSYWPVIKEKHSEKCNIADTWTYGSTMILLNLQEMVEQYNNQRHDFMNEIERRSYIPIGDLCLSDVGYYTGYASALRVFTIGYERYHLRGWHHMKKNLVDRILKMQNEDGIFKFYKYEISVNGIEKKIDKDRDGILETYLIYIALYLS